MPKPPTEALEAAAADLPDVAVGESCNQKAYKAKGKAFLYVGPGAKGVGFKAMFKLKASLPAAAALAEAEPERYQVGTGGWVTVRFSAQAPLLKKHWGKWLKEAYANAAPAPKARAAKRR